MVQVAILVDDMIDSGKTLGMAARALQENGVQSVYVLISHGTFICLANYYMVVSKAIH
jgi:phosphoribosylpyrophosphate synthetase